MTRISRVIIRRCITDCVTAHSCRIAVNDLIWLQLSNQTIHYRCTYQYSHSIRLTTYSHNYANKRGKNLNDTKPCGYVRLELTKNPVPFDFDMLAALVMNRILSERLGTFIVDEEWSWFVDEVANLQLSKHPPNLHQLLNIGVHNHVLGFHARGSHGALKFRHPGSRSPAN